ncbi:hypothetical protein [Amycolatopsis benzoatilytica]|uniref:hypothetical protein n=1 Tax=Amycolatopsis benzoatilytica TaxID=346045 RepID=UPI00036C9C20|nr:hypothetical protein [Amycolatopsis benzoatilytica]
MVLADVAGTGQAAAVVDRIEACGHRALAVQADSGDLACRAGTGGAQSGGRAPGRTRESSDVLADPASAYVTGSTISVDGGHAA